MWLFTWWTHSIILANTTAIMFCFVFHSWGLMRICRVPFSKILGIVCDKNIASLITLRLWAVFSQMRTSCVTHNRSPQVFHTLRERRQWTWMKWSKHHVTVKPLYVMSGRSSWNYSFSSQGSISRSRSCMVNVISVISYSPSSLFQYECLNTETNSPQPWL